MSRTTLIAAALILTAPALADAQTRPASQAVGRRAQVNGMRLYYEVSGRGAPLIVLHGSFMNIPSMGHRSAMPLTGGGS